MKEGMLGVLIYLFENYIVDELSFDPDQDELTEELEGAGFPSIKRMFQRIIQFGFMMKKKLRAWGNKALLY